MSELRPFQRRSFLRGIAGGVWLAQTATGFLVFDVTAANRGELTALFRALTARVAFLTAGGAPPPNPSTSAPSDDRPLGPTVLPDDLTVTVGLSASLCDGRYGLGPSKPAHPETMRAFSHDNLDPAISDGDLLVQLCAGRRDTVGHAMLDILAHTTGGMRLRWRIDGFRFPPRPVGIPRDWMGFKDGITNLDTTNTTQMNRQVWVQPGPPEPAWTAGGTYQAVRIIRMFLNKWATVPVGEQERIFGQRKINGTPLYATSPTTSDNLDPIYTNDPQGLLTPLNSHIRLANPQTPQTAATSAILRHSYQYDRSPDVQGNPDMGHAFCCFQQQLATYIATAGDRPARLGIGLCGRPTIPDRYIYVTNQLDNTLSVIDASTYNVVATVSLPAGSSPRGVALTLNGQFLYVADGGSNNVSVLDTRTNRIVASVPVGSQPVSVAVTPDGASAYVANTGSSDVSVIDTQTNHVVRVVPAGQYPAGVAVTHDGGSVYVANELSANVTVINTRSGAVEATLPYGTGPFNAATSPTDNTAYVADPGPDNLVVIDTRTRRVASTVTLGLYGTDPFNAAANRHALYVTNQGVNTLSVIDPHTQRGDHREDRQQSLRRGRPTRARSITEPLLKGVTSAFGDHAHCG